MSMGIGTREGNKQTNDKSFLIHILRVVGADFGFVAANEFRSDTQRRAWRKYSESRAAYHPPTCHRPTTPAQCIPGRGNALRRRPGGTPAICGEYSRRQTDICLVFSTRVCVREVV